MKRFSATWVLGLMAIEPCGTFFLVTIRSARTCNRMATAQRADAGAGAPCGGRQAGVRGAGQEEQEEEQQEQEAQEE